MHLYQSHIQAILTFRRTKTPIAASTEKFLGNSCQIPGKGEGDIDSIHRQENNHIID